MENPFVYSKECLIDFHKCPCVEGESCGRHYARPNSHQFFVILNYYIHADLLRFLLGNKWSMSSCATILIWKALVYVATSGLLTLGGNLVLFSVDVDSLKASLASMTITGVSRLTFTSSTISAVTLCAASFLTLYRQSCREGILNPSSKIL